jgi:hypothetical protein
MKYKVTILLISIIILVVLTTLFLINRTKGQAQDSVNGLYSITIKDIDEMDKYPEVKEFLIENGHYDELQQMFRDLQTNTSKDNNKGKLDKDIEAAIIEKYNLEKPTQNKANNFEVTIIIEYGSNKAINSVQLK